MVKKSNDLDVKLNALSSKFRRLILGLIYAAGPIYQSGILKHVSVESNKLAYHLNILRTAGLIDREYRRNGKNVSRYLIKEDGIRFLKNIGALDELRGLTKQKSIPTNRLLSGKPNKLREIRYQQHQQHQQRPKVNRVIA